MPCSHHPPQPVRPLCLGQPPLPFVSRVFLDKPSCRSLPTSRAAGDLVSCPMPSTGPAFPPFRTTYLAGWGLLWGDLYEEVTPDEVGAGRLAKEMFVERIMMLLSGQILRDLAKPMSLTDLLRKGQVGVADNVVTPKPWSQKRGGWYVIEARQKLRRQGLGL